jgi:hypothetical protein
MSYESRGYIRTVLGKPWMPWVYPYRLFGPWKKRDALFVAGLARSIVGFLVSVFVYLHFGADEQQTNEMYSTILATMAISVGLTLLLAAAFATRAKDWSPEAREPLVRAVKIAFVIGLAGLLQHLQNDDGSVVGALIRQIALVGYLWFVPFTYAAAFIWFLNPHGSSNRFPHLAPIVTGVTVSAVTAISLISGDDGPLPVAPWIALTLSGLLTSLALVAVELLLLRTRPNHRAPAGPASGTAGFGGVIAMGAVVLLLTIASVANPWSPAPRHQPYNAFDLPAEEDVTVGPVRQVRVAFGTRLTIDPDNGPAVAVSDEGVGIVGGTATGLISVLGFYSPDVDQYPLCRAALWPDLPMATYSWSGQIPPVPQCVLWSGRNKTRHLSLVLLTEVSGNRADFTLREWHWKA